MAAWYVQFLIMFFSALGYNDGFFNMYMGF